MKRFLIAALLLAFVPLLGGCVFKTPAKISERLPFDENFTELALTLGDCDLTIADAKESGTYVLIETYDDTPITAQIAGGALRIEQKDERSYFAKLTPRERPTVAVYLAEREGIGLSGSLGSGSVRSEREAAAYGPVSLTAGSGSVSLARLRAVSVSVTAGSGRIAVEGGASAGDVKLKIGSGDIALSGYLAEGLVSVETGSGKAVVDNVGAALFESRSGSGSILARNTRISADAVMKLGSGSADLEELFVSGVLAVETGSGNVRFTRSEAGTVRAVTASGSITGTLVSADWQGTVKGHGSYSSDEKPSYEFRTGSGSVDVEFVS